VGFASGCAGPCAALRVVLVGGYFLGRWHGH
jgi:hypothetical protein